jgi:hypothetical protein
MIVNEMINIASKADTRGFKQTETASAKLGRSLKNLAGTLGLALSAAAVIQFGKESVAAFLADDKAAAQLTNTLKNLNLELNAPAMETFVENLARAAGVTDEQLRPALQSLLQTTGSFSASQKLLAQAMDLSAGSTVDLATVAQDLGQAFVGNTRGLRKYDLGLSQAELKAASFEEIQTRINELFSGANAARLSTYSGKADKLKVSYEEFKESAGKGIISLLMGEEGSDKGAWFTSFLDKAGAKLEYLGMAFNKSGQSWAALLSGNLDEVRRLNGPQNYVSGTVSSAIAKAAEAQKIKSDKVGAARAKDLAKAQKEQTKALKEAALLKKQSIVFDQQQIQIVAALKRNISAEERTKLELQSALLMGNTEEANRLIVQLAGAQGMTQELRTFLLTLPTAKNPFEAWLAYLDAVQNKLNSLKVPSFAPFMGNSGAGQADFGAAKYQVPTNPYAGTYYGETGRDMPSNLIITLDGAAFDYAVSNSVQSANRAGININGSASG